MNVVFLAAGAGGMYCGSCLRDNRLAATLLAQKRSVTLIPLYTPLTTDEMDVSIRSLYYGGINVYLQQKFGLFRRLPRMFDRLFNAATLLRHVGKLASKTRPEELGALTVSVLRGEHGAQAKELHTLVEAMRTFGPDVINLPNLMFLGLARPLAEETGATIVCTLSGEDFFLDHLPDPYRTQAFDLIAESARDVDAFVSVTRYFADYAAEHFALARERIHYVPLGISAAEFHDTSAPLDHAPFTIGYLARICPEKGLAVLCKALVQLRKQGRDCRLRVAGNRAPIDRQYWHDCQSFLRGQGHLAALHDHGEPEFAAKREFLRSLHVLSVPTVYPEAKGLYALEAMAAGVPVVLPRHGSIPELIEATQGGVMFEAGDVDGLVRALGDLMDDGPRRLELGRQGREAVRTMYDAEAMANATWDLFETLRASANSASR